ncbi:MAG: flavin-containing monooxygenase [Aquabacterium sp.]
MQTEIIDVLIVGAGISGISAAVHLQQRCPDRRFEIIESRERLGGTWDLFRYPGVRSDSDMYTLGFRFKPWKDRKSIAAAPVILDYLRETVREYGLERHITYGQKLVHADWRASDAAWTVQIRQPDGSVRTMQARFLHLCCGYYRYDQGYMPDYPGQAQFQGRLVHPQQWPDDLDHAGKQVVVIGSGATAVTLVPAMAATAAKVTMLQRSPTWMFSLPAVDRIAMGLRAVLPLRAAHALTRWKNVMMAIYLFWVCRKRPQKVGDFLLKQAAKELPPGYDLNTHFKPRYNPWEQRLCLLPDADLFKSITAGRAAVVTDQIETFTADGLRLKSGAELKADIIVSATGLELQMLGGASLSVDGQPVEGHRLVNYKGVMYGGLPNLAATFGYTNASWTLKADLTSEYVCRLLNHMRDQGLKVCTPDVSTAGPLQPWVDFSSGYFKRAEHLLPQQGSVKPFKLNQNYITDLLALRYGKVDDGALRFAG